MGAGRLPLCGGRLRRIGEDVSETLDYVPGRFKVIRHIRAKLSCRACDTVVATPAPDHVIARGRAGAGLLAHIEAAPFWWTVVGLGGLRLRLHHLLISNRREIAEAGVPPGPVV